MMNDAKLTTALTEAKAAIVRAGVVWVARPDPVLETALVAMNLPPSVRIIVTDPGPMPDPVPEAAPASLIAETAVLSSGRTSPPVPEFRPVTTLPHSRPPKPEPSPVDSLRADLALADWSLRVELDGRVTLLKGFDKIPIYTGPLGEVIAFAHHRILNVVPHHLLTLGDLYDNDIG